MFYLSLRPWTLTFNHQHLTSPPWVLKWMFFLFCFFYIAKFQEAASFCYWDTAIHKNGTDVHGPTWSNIYWRYNNNVKGLTNSFGPADNDDTNLQLSGASCWASAHGVAVQTTALLSWLTALKVQFLPHSSTYTKLPTGLNWTRRIDDGWQPLLTFPRCCRNNLSQVYSETEDKSAPRRCS